MIGLLSRIAHPLLLAMEPERAHRATIRALQLMPKRSCAADDAGLGVEAFGLQFPNPLGMAAGFDKNAEVPDALLRLGFGFTEVGTLTPLAQAGNPRPRVFRLAQDGGLINRLGFNNAGHAAALARLAARGRAGGIVGVNIGANKDSADRAGDYVQGITAFAQHASYFTVNVSSPNTPGLRNLQHGAELDSLLARVLEARESQKRRCPVLLKIAPDLTLDEIDSIVAIARARKIDGMIVSNTTISRPAGLQAGGLASALARETGGLSGSPLFSLSTTVLAQVFLRVEGQFPLIGAGGIASAADAIAKLEAGASLLQLYTALVFQGPSLISAIKHGLRSALNRRNLPGPAALTGSNARGWAKDHEA